MFYFTSNLQSQINGDKEIVTIIDTTIVFPLTTDNSFLNIHYILQESEKKNITINTLFISDSTKKHYQKIIDTTSYIYKIYGRPTDIIRVIDINLDGFNDFGIVDDIGGSHPDISYKYYLYNPDKKVFIYSKEFSDLCCHLSIDYNTKSIYLESYRWQEEKSTKYTYKVYNNKPKLTAIRIEYVFTEDNKQKYRTVIKKLIDGKMKVISDTTIWRGM